MYFPQAWFEQAEFLRQFAASRPVPSSAEAKEDFLMEALSAGAQADLGCVADQLRWWMGAAARQRVSSRYPRSAACADADGDGSSVLLGDPDDQDPGRHPGAVEVANGVDDDGDGAADELFLQGPLSTLASSPTPGAVPVEVRGQAIPGRTEYVSLGNVAAGQRLRITFCAPLDAPALIGAYAPGTSFGRRRFILETCTSAQPSRTAMSWAQSVLAVAMVCRGSPPSSPRKSTWLKVGR